MKKYKCDICEGSGQTKQFNKICIQDIEGGYNPCYEIPFVYRCTKCGGTGELNWVERIFGKMKNKEDEDFSELLKKIMDKYVI